MGEETKISWTHHTFSPWIGCSHARFPPGHPKAGHVHSGCVHCYAQTLNAFHVGWNGGRWGPGAPRHVAAESAWKKPLAWARAAAKAGERRRTFFSLGDPLDEEAPKEARLRYFQLIRDTAVVKPDGTPLPSRYWPDLALMLNTGTFTAAGLDHLLLTKRPWRWPLIHEDVRPLVWLGTSASDQETWDAWVGELRKAQGFRHLFVSLEPMVGPVDDMDLATQNRLGGRIDGVICGGESGSKARPFDLAWARSVRDQCRSAGVAYYFKQAGARPCDAPETWREWRGRGASTVGLDSKMMRVVLSHPAGADPSEWPEDLRIQEMPT